MILCNRQPELIGKFEWQQSNSRVTSLTTKPDQLLGIIDHCVKVVCLSALSLSLENPLVWRSKPALSLRFLSCKNGSQSVNLIRRWSSPAQPLWVSARDAGTKIQGKGQLCLCWSPFQCPPMAPVRVFMKRPTPTYICLVWAPDPGPYFGDYTPLSLIHNCPHWIQEG